MMRRGGLARAGLLASVLFVSTAVAAEPLPDPASVSVPTITDGRDPKIVADGWKYFYFWRADTTYAEAYRDIADCYRFLPVANADFSVPAFAPWTSTPNKHVIEPTYPGTYGLVGDLMASMVAGPIERRRRQSRMRRCLEPQGYERYPAPEAQWEMIIDNYSPASIVVQAKLASGPPPDAEALPSNR